MGGFRPFQSPHGEVKASAPLGASQTFEAYDPVQLSGNQLVTCTVNTKILDDAFIGFAATPAKGILAGSRTSGSGALEIASPKFFGDVGAAENTIREYIRPTIGQYMATNNFWTAATTATQDVVGGGDLGALFQMSAPTGAEWGLIDVAGVPGTDACARIVMIFDTDGNRFNADTADTACTGDTTGPTIVFEIVDLQGLDQVMGG